jgi:hypothetical protein
MRKEKTEGRRRKRKRRIERITKQRRDWARRRERKVTQQPKALTMLTTLQKEKVRKSGKGRGRGRKEVGNYREEIKLNLNTTVINNTMRN